MKKRIPLSILVFFSGILFTVLFYKQTPGLNLLLFEAIIISVILFIQHDRPQSRIAIFTCCATLASAIAFVINYTNFAFVVNLVSFYLFIGVLIFQEAKSVSTSFGLAASNLRLSVQKFFAGLGSVPAGQRGTSIRTYAWRFRIIFFLVPVILLFLVMYAMSNPYFNDALADGLQPVIDLFRHMEFDLPLVFSLGISCSVFALVRVAVPEAVQYDMQSSIQLQRRRRSVWVRNSFGLKKEVIAAKFLFIALNILLLLVNILDIRHVWFNFQWNGTYLKQFVHEGTYLLIVSIFISIGIVLYFFRGNVNFYRKSKALKQLAVLWMIQNAILAVSVAIRNFHYISYFALAYKRIGVIFFLILTLYGIWTVVLKIRNQYSVFYLFRNNLMAMFIMILFISFFNWENMIVRYNFNHAKTAFLHYDFLAEMPDKALPLLDRSKEELQLADVYQQHLFRFNVHYMSAEEFLEKIKIQKELFRKKWEAKSLLSWNYAEYAAYQKLFMTAGK